MSRRPDDDRAKARELVEVLYDLAARSRGDGFLLEAEQLSEAACLLDSYQSGTILATPHRLTGYGLMRIDVLAVSVQSAFPPLLTRRLQKDGV